MAHRHLRCDTNRLRLLLDDALPAPKQAEVVHHLDDCPECQRTLENLAADRRWWDELPKLNDTDEHKQQAASGRSATCVGGRGVDSEEGPLSLDFLDPADEAEHLGRLDRFAVTEFLGRGGMGVVLKAFDASLNRPVAIKVLAPYFASSAAARRRFDREAKAAATVVHPHVVAIHSVDAWKGLPYLVMSYIAGRSLQERLDSEGPLETKEILRIGMQTASGLAAAHAQGLVHRDVKPANILLENGVGRVWLTDFGLARAVDDASLTQSGVIAGTPQYMAPEQAQGHAVDHRADLFSLGSTLYAMCTGHAPFRAESAMAVLRRVCDDRPRPVRLLNPDVPAWLAGIIDKLHAKNPADRFQTAAEVAELFEKCLAHVQQPETNSLPAQVSNFSDKPKRRFRRRTAALAGMVVLAAFGAAWAWLGQPPAREAAVQSPNTGLRLEAVPGTVLQRYSVTSQSRDGLLETQPDMEGIRRQAAALAAELTHPAGAGFGDPTDAVLWDTQRRLEALEQELAKQTP